MEGFIAPITIGLWAWLFCETLSREGHIFSFTWRVFGPAANVTEGLPGLYFKYLNCPICHAGMVATVYSLVMIFTSCHPYTVLFTYPVVAMSVAKVMAIKF